MFSLGVFQILIFSAVIVALTKPVGLYLYNVFAGEKTLLTPVLRPVEKLWYAVSGVNEEEDMPWTKYAVAMLLFSLVGVLVTYAMLRLQMHLPLNPQKFGDKQMPPDLAFNTANSFATNTNWQSYTPEVTVSYFSNMVSLAIHNWMSAATGAAIAIALIRGFARRSAKGIGNFWVDITRFTLFVLLPFSLVAGAAMIFSGVPQNFDAPLVAKGLEGAAQTIGLGPVASQEVIKMLGTNGGGIFNANSSHPFENPNNFTNFLQLILIFLIPAGLTYTFGKMVKNTREGWAVFGAMAAMFLVGAFVSLNAEHAGTPEMTKAGVNVVADGSQPGGNMEGKEERFGIGASTLFATVTTDASCGAVNSMHDSMTPIGGMVPMVNILLGEVVFGGVGAGLYGILMFAIIAVFIAGLMVGRTPEYVGKKIEKFEVQMAMIACLILAADVLIFSAISTNTNYPNKTGPETKDTFAQVTLDPTKQAADVAALPALASWNHNPGTAYGSPTDTYYGSTRNNTNNSGAHGFSEIFYAYASGTGNNGSAFAGISANTPHYNATIGLSMLIGRFLMIIPLLALAGSLARKKIVPVSAGTFPTDNATFAGLLVAVVIIVNALTYFPAVSLGPIVEHFQMLAGKTF
jgi:K+-transporting ATPase ATPase A chain